VELAVPFAVAVTEQVPTGDVEEVVQVEEEDSEELAPLLGTVNVTTLPLTGLLYASSTCTIRGLVNAAPITALCGVPDDAVIVAAAAALTAILLLTRLGEPLKSATVMVFVPEVFSVMLNVPTPAVRFSVPVGKTALVSVEVNVIGPV
jgi:hypothetical protein